jgi:hypothetical protein
VNEKLLATTGYYYAGNEITMGIGVLSTHIRPTEFYSAFVVIFIISNFYRLSRLGRDRADEL